MCAFTISNTSYCPREWHCWFRYRLVVYWILRKRKLQKEKMTLEQFPVRPRICSSSYIIHTNLHTALLYAMSVMNQVWKKCILMSLDLYMWKTVQVSNITAFMILFFFIHFSAVHWALLHPSRDISMENHQREHHSDLSTKHDSTLLLCPETASFLSIKSTWPHVHTF